MDVSRLQDLEASAEKLSTHAEKIKNCKHFLSVGKTHMDEAAKKVGISQKASVW